MGTLDLALEYARGHPGPLLADILAVTGVPVVELIVLPILYGAVVAGTGRRGVPPLLVGGILLAFGAISVLHHVRDAAMQLIIPSFEAHMKVALMERLLTRQRCVARSTGDVVFLLVQVADTVEIWMRFLNHHLLPYLATALVGTVAIARYDLPLAAGFVALLATLVYLFGAARSSCHGPATDHAERIARLHADLEEVVRNANTVQPARTVAHLRHTACPAAYSSYPAAVRCARRYQPLMVPALLLFVLLFLWRSNRLLRTGRVHQSEFVACFLVVTGLVPIVLEAIDIIGDVVLDAGYVGSLDTLFADDPAPRRPPPPGRPPSDYVIGLRDVTFAYCDDGGCQNTLQHVTLGFRPGVCSALAGPVGAGKTTVLRLLMGFCAPLAGDCYVDGRWYGELGADDVRRMVGCVPQEPVLFAGSVLYNVRYGHEDAVDEATAAAFVRQHGGDALAHRLLEDVGPGGSRLSGGQRQLVWCLRLFLRPPPVVLMDEPTASMDDGSRDHLLRLLAELMAGRTVVMVSHDPVLLAHARETVVL